MSIKELFAYLRVKDAARAITFYREAFGAEEKFRLTEPGGRIGHAELDFGGTTLMLSDEYPELGIRRNRITDAARALFLAKGFDGTTIAAIAREAGVAVPTVCSGAAVGRPAAAACLTYPSERCERSRAGVRAGCEVLPRSKLPADGLKGAVRRVYVRS
jgi:uncharacterized glyoxalase superfamily protein PhnB